MGSKAKVAMEMVRWGNEIISHMEAFERLSDCRDDYPLNTDKAAILLDLSKSSLERMRAKGTGPVYFQNGIAVRPNGQPPDEAVLGTNQAVRYFKPDLKAWHTGGMVSSIREAAIKKGQMFATVFDLAQEQAFFVAPDGSIDSLVAGHTLAEVFQRFEDDQPILWLSAIEAASRRWASSVEHQELASRVQQTLSRMQSAVVEALSDTELGESLKG